MANGIRVLVIDHNRTLAEAIALGLGQAGITGEGVTSIEAACQASANGETDLILADVQVIRQDGSLTGQQPLTNRVNVPLVVVGGAEEHTDLACAAFRAGVRGWVTRDSPMQHLCRVIRGVLRDETWLPPSLLTRVLSDLTADRRQTDAAAEMLASLTSRESEVLSCLCRGMTRQSIAQHLFLSPCTVRTHVQNLLIKLDVHSSVAAVALAQRAGIASENHPAGLGLIERGAPVKASAG